MDAVLRWLLSALYWFVLVFGMIGAAAWTVQWTAQRTPGYRLRGPGWLASVGLWLWAVWFAFLASLVLPQLFDPFALVDLHRANEFAWLRPVLILLVVGYGAPSVLLFIFRLAWTKVGRKRREQAKELRLLFEKFEPIGHRLNWNQIQDTPAVAVYDDGEPERTTVGKLLNEILPGWFRLPGEPKREWAPVPESRPFLGGLTIEAPSGKKIGVGSFPDEGVESAGFAAMLIGELLRLFRITGTNRDILLFFHEHEAWHYKDSWGERYKFFVVHRNRIVMSSFELSNDCADFFDYAVLISMYEEDAWQRGEGEKDVGDDSELTTGQSAFQRWWYRRFYTRTATGQKKVFLNETLYNYVPPERLEANRDARLRRIEWMVIGIIGLLLACFVFDWF